MTKTVASRELKMTATYPAMLSRTLVSMVHLVWHCAAKQSERD
jgi:hypothetical protein